jgi:hypothetical protein
MPPVSSSLHLHAPDGRKAAPEPGSRRRTLSGEVRKKVLEYITKSEVEVTPIFISFKTGLNYNAVKSACLRMARERLVVQTPVGYTTPDRSVEEALDKQLKIDGQAATLPKVHDIHMTFKRENIAKMLARPELWHGNVAVTYELQDSDRGPDPSKMRHLSPNQVSGEQVTRDRGPAEPKVQHAFIRRRATIASLSDDKFHLDRIFDPKDPASIYQLWKVQGGILKEIKGGYQEELDFLTHKLVLQFYRTGTIKVIIANSEHPFNAQQWQSAIQAIDGLYMSKTGVSFWDISNFFHLERVDLGNDVIGDQTFSGISRLCLTVQQFDSYLYRVYEKVLGKDNVIRTELCLNNGTIEDGSFKQAMAIFNAGVMPQHVGTGLFALMKDRRDDREDMRRQQDEIYREHAQIKGLREALEKHIADDRERFDKLIGLMSRKLAGSEAMS